MAILGSSAFLNLYGLTGEGYANTYYAAAVKNMLISPYNFFFVSFDAGFVSVDKPPLGLWIQAASAYLFGFDGLALLLPQAIAGVLSVALLYHLVHRTFGTVAGHLSALILALTPIVVATSRNNTADMLLVLTVLLAAWAVMRASEKGSPGWLFVGAAIVGLGFNIKMLQAFLVLPAFYLLYLLAARTTWRWRFVHLGLATLVLFAVSLSWALAVDLTPEERRPYVGSSFNNSVADLIVGYNGIIRLIGVPSGPPGGDGKEAPPGGAPSMIPGGAGENGEPGPFRLLNERLAGQVSWLLPLSIVGLAAGWRTRLRLPLDPQQGALVLWGTWLLTMSAYFSVSGMGHRYYLVMLAPAIAALSGIGVVALWKHYREPGWTGWLLPAALVGTAAVQAYFLSEYPDWSRILTPAILVACLLAAVGLVILRRRPKAAPLAAFVGVTALLVAPAVWAAFPIWQGSVPVLPAAGPEEARMPFSDGGSGAPFGPGGPPFGSEADPALVEFLTENRGDAGYLVAAANAIGAAPLILSTDEPVISLGGFIGFDAVLSTDELAELVDEGAVRYFLVLDPARMEEMMSEMMPGDSGSQGAPMGPPENEATGWVRENCEQVSPELWQSSASESAELMPQTLYDCGTRIL